MSGRHVLILSYKDNSDTRRELEQLKMKSRVRESRDFVTALVYFSLFLDNVLLTVIVPILPDFLAQSGDVGLPENISTFNVPNGMLYTKTFDLHYVPNMLRKHPLAGPSVLNLSTPIGPPPTVRKVNLDEENVSIGILLGVKALVQLIFNPIVGGSTAKFGYRIPIVFGTFNLLLAALVFAIGDNYISLVFARAVQGIGSACIGVCGMSLVAQLYPEEEKRSKIMGIVLGSVALGVLVGYPVGGCLYDFVGKAAPFYIVSILIGVDLLLQCKFLELIVPAETPEDSAENNTMTWWPLCTDLIVFVVVLAICISTSTMAILEPCLPIWLLSNLNPKKWQLGTVFIPDSVGYLLGTNFFGKVAYQIGQIKIAVIALIMVGLSCILIPSATTVWSLMLPHFVLGLGIGILDAALVPFLATYVDQKYGGDVDGGEGGNGEFFSNYGAIYAIQQMAVSLAYSIGPLLGGELAKILGFPWLMRSMGSINCLYAPILLFITSRVNLQGSLIKSKDVLLNNGEDANHDYKRFYNSID
ncbi:synaptic vesicular amine transporter [Lutzomyia longipalpis]|uniref:synaptic vesicular amine transporter n=1 Tax=Lutzomyia longipalpis TaxID=7200 RepID=UPI00248406D4|nr:synaptic vesicular amine transporter [Lutzomyia longipalpis]